MLQAEKDTLIASHPITEAQVQNAIGIILSDRIHYNTTLNYAVGYCQAGRCLSGEDLRVQCLYILNNIVSWRHPEAKTVRDILRKFSKQK